MSPEDCESAEYRCRLALDVRLQEMDRRIEVELKRRDEAVERAYAENRQRLSDMNEIRGAMEDAAKHFITRAEYDAKHEAVVVKGDVLRQLIEDTRSSAKWAIGLAAICLSLIVAVLGMLWSHVGR